MFVVVAAAVVALFLETGVGLSVYGVVALSYLAVKLTLAICYRPAHGDPSHVGTVAAVVPFYYLNQTFLEMPVMYGDDRRLINYALTRGKVLFQGTRSAPGTGCGSSASARWPSGSASRSH